MGRLPPQAIEVEEAVLGALMLEKEAYIVCSDILIPESFYNDVNGKVYSLIRELSDKNKPVDMLTVVELARNKGILEVIGGAFYISSLCTRVASASHIEYHARIIQQKYIAREAIRCSSELQSFAYDDGIDAEDIISDFVGNAEMLVNLSSSGNRILTNQENLSDAIERAKERQKLHESGQLVGIPPRLQCERDFIASYQGGELNIIAARPGMGKTAYMLSIARHFASIGLAGMVFSLEMTAKELTDRNVSAMSEMNAYRYKTGNIYQNEWEKLDNAITKLWDYPIYIDDTSNASLNHIRKVAKIYKMKGLLNWIMIDYLQLMNTRSQNRNYNREQEISETTRSLKGLAKDLDVPIFLLSQLNRDNEKAAGKTPALSNLRESGAIEQDADRVILLHRPEYYFKDDPELKGIIEIIIAKNRSGATGTATARTTETISEFYDLQINQYPQQTDKPF